MSRWSVAFAKKVACLSVQLPIPHSSPSCIAGCTPFHKVIRNGTKDTRGFDSCPHPSEGAFNLRLAGIISYYLFLVKRDNDGPQSVGRDGSTRK